LGIRSEDKKWLERSQPSWRTSVEDQGGSVRPSTRVAFKVVVRGTKERRCWRLGPGVERARWPWPAPLANRSGEAPARPHQESVNGGLRGAGPRQARRPARASPHSGLYKTALGRWTKHSSRDLPIGSEYSKDSSAPYILSTCTNSWVVWTCACDTSDLRSASKVISCGLLSSQLWQVLFPVEYLSCSLFSSKGAYVYM